MRRVAVINIFILTLLAWIVLAHTGLVWPFKTATTEIAIWIVVAFSGISTILNSITPSKIERIWAPVAGIQLICSLVVAW